MRIHPHPIWRSRSAQPDDGEQRAGELEPQRSGALPGGRRRDRRRHRRGERGGGRRPQRRVGGAGRTLRRDRRQHDGRRGGQLLRRDRRSGRGVRRDPAPPGAVRRHRPLRAVRLRGMPVAGPGSRDPGGDPAGGAAGARGQAAAAYPLRRRDRARRPAGRGDRGRTLGTGSAARHAALWTAPATGFWPRPPATRSRRDAPRTSSSFR